VTRPEAVRLVKELDGRCDPRFVRDYCDWIGIREQEFWDVAERFRGKMWQRRDDDSWQLADPIWEQERCDENVNLDDLIARLDPRRCLEAA
jgi:hypothetical protein